MLVPTTQSSIENYRCLCSKLFPFFTESFVNAALIQFLVVSIGHSRTFYVVFVPLEYIPSIPVLGGRFDRTRCLSPFPV